MKEVIAGLLLVFGSLVGLLAAVGLLRMPDFYSRLQASTKAQTLGLMTIMAGVALSTGSPAVAVKALLVLTFVFLTAPVAAHLLARSAYLLGVPLWEGTAEDELADKYDLPKRELRGERVL